MVKCMTTKQGGKEESQGACSSGAPGLGTRQDTRSAEAAAEAPGHRICQGSSPSVLQKRTKAPRGTQLAGVALGPRHRPSVWMQRPHLSSHWDSTWAPAPGFLSVHPLPSSSLGPLDHILKAAVGASHLRARGAGLQNSHIPDTSVLHTLKKPFHALTLRMAPRTPPPCPGACTGPCPPPPAGSRAVLHPLQLQHSRSAVFETQAVRNEALSRLHFLHHYPSFLHLAVGPLRGTGRPWSWLCRGFEELTAEKHTAIAAGMLGTPLKLPTTPGLQASGRGTAVEYALGCWLV